MVSFIALALSFLFGAAAVVAAQAVALLYLLRRLRRAGGPASTDQDPPPETRDLDPEQSVAFAWNKQGVIWVLEPDKVPKISSVGGISAKPLKDKKEIVEVYPEKKYAKIRDHSLTLTNSDGSNATIELFGCMVHAVSASSLASRKWAKRYPIKIENQSSIVYNGSNMLYIYLETSWDKESWCRALRLASSKDNQNVNWHKKVTDEFHGYLSLLMSAYPFLKSRIGSKEAAEKVDVRMMDGSSKVRLFLKKLAKKASKNSSDHKMAGALPMLGREEKSGGESVAGSHKSATSDKSSNKSPDTETMQSSFNGFGARNQFTAGLDSDFDSKSGHDEGILSLNLLVARLFFDARKNNTITSYFQERIQRAFSNLRTPLYVGAITCVNFNLGTLPPYIHGIRVLPMDLNEVWALEVDIEYSGHALLEAETRLEVNEHDFQRGLLNASMEGTSSREASSDLLEGFEHYEELSTSNMADTIVKGSTGDNANGLTSTKNSGWASVYTSRWKSIINLVAGQVSQLPLSLAIRFMSMRGTLRVHIKPPPSDQLWFGFTSMPNIEWNFESFVGEHKITGAPVILIGSRLKAAIREALVLPNCEYISIPWMVSDKDDWVPRKSAPFLWTNQEGGHSASFDGACSTHEPVEASKNQKDIPLEGSDRNKNDSSSDQLGEGALKNVQLSRRDDPSTERGQHLEHGYSSLTSISGEPIHDQVSELTEPLLVNSQLEVDGSQRSGYSSDSIMSRDQNAYPLVSDELKPKKIGKRAKMIDIGKKMSEKLEEKRRHLEEKSRIIVEKMRDNAKTT